MHWGVDLTWRTTGVLLVICGIAAPPLMVRAQQPTSESTDSHEVVTGHVPCRFDRRGGSLRATCVSARARQAMEARAVVETTLSDPPRQGAFGCPVELRTLERHGRGSESLAEYPLNVRVTRHDRVVLHHDHCCYDIGSSCPSHGPNWD